MKLFSIVLAILLACNVLAKDVPKHRSKSYRQVEDSQTNSLVNGNDKQHHIDHDATRLKKKNGSGKNDNINRYLGKASKHGKRVKSKRGKSGKKKKNLFGSRSGHTPTTPKPIPSPTLKPVTPSPVISWPTNPPFSFVSTPFPTSDSTPSIGTEKTMAPTEFECMDDSQCDDGKECTIDQCDVSGQCSHEDIPGCQVKGALLETFYGITGSAVSDLTNNPKYIYNEPDKREIIQVNRDYETTLYSTIFLEVPVDEAENYGFRFTTYVTPAVRSGYYTLGFSIGAGTASIMYLSENEDPANKVEYGGTRVKLEAGKSYYFLALIIPGETLNSVSGNGQSLSAILFWQWYGPRLDTRDGYIDRRSQLFLEPPISCSLNKECMRFNPSNDPCMQSLCDSETTLCNDVANLCEDGKVYCGISSERKGNDYAPTCAQCPEFYHSGWGGLVMDITTVLPKWYCGGACKWKPESADSIYDGSCMHTATVNCGDSIRPQKELTEGCVTEPAEDLNNCRKDDGFGTDPNAYDTIDIGKTVCGQLSSYNDVEGGYIRSDQDFFRLSLPRSYGKIKVKLELMPGDSFDAKIQLRDNAPCVSTSSIYIQGEMTSPGGRWSSSPRAYELTAAHLGKGDYRIEVSTTNLANNPLECGGKAHSYHLTVTDEDPTCTRSGVRCGTWRLGADDDGCYADKTGYNDSTLIGTYPGCCSGRFKRYFDGWWYQYFWCI